tara:strand:+ start:11502 stop:12692 length:1191 start_codon:yes stop_codon:yes gene_type:complete
VGASAAFFATTIIAREVSPEEAAPYFTIYSVLMICAAFSSCGLDNSLVRFIGRDKDVSVDVFDKSLFLSGFLSLLVASLVYLASEFISYELFAGKVPAEVVRMISPSIFFQTLISLSAFAFQGLGRYVLSVFFINIFINFILGLFVYFGLLKDSFELVLAYTLISGVCALFSVCAIIYAVLGYSRARVAWPALLSSCIPLWIVMAMSQVVNWSGQIFAGIYSPVVEVAQIAVAQRTASLIGFTLMAVNLVVAPKFSALFSGGDHLGLQKLAKSAILFGLVTALPITFMMIFYSGEIMLLYGDAYQSGGIYLTVFAVGHFVAACTGPVGYLLIMSGNESDLRNATIFAGLVAIMLTWFLAVKFGSIGVALGAAFAIAVQNIISLYYVKVRLGFNVVG